MRKSLFIILIVLFILPGLAAAAAPQPGQQEQALQILGEVARGCTVALGGWQCSTAGGAWQPYRLGQTLEQGQLTLKTVMELGDTFSGQKIVGQLLHLRLRFLARGLVKVRVLGGEKPLAAFEVDASSGTEKELSGDVLLADSFQPGRSELTVEAENLGFKPERSEFWPPRRRPLPEEGIYFALLEAALDFPSLHGRLEQVRDWLTSMQTAYGLINPEMKRYTFTGKPYDIPDQRRISPGRLKQLQQEWTRAVLAFDREAFRSGRWDDLRRSLLRSQKLSGGLRDFAREFKVNIIGNAHIDIAWLWRMAETKMVARNTFASVLQNMVEYPEMRYAQSQAVTYDWMEKEYPDIFARIRQKVRDGQWEIVGGMWVEPDCNLISGESWVRQFLYGKAFFKEKFGVDVRVGWNPDSFGYNWNMPQLYAPERHRLFHHPENMVERHHSVPLLPLLVAGGGWQSAVDLFPAPGLHRRPEHQ